MQTQEQLFSMLLNEDEITWQSILYDLVKAGDIDPWDVDISALTEKYVEMLTQLKDMDFRVSGKVLLAAAILLKIKSDRLMGADFAHFEQMFQQPEEYTFDELLDEGSLDAHLEGLESQKEEKPQLIPRTPQPRERKVTIFDLVDALNRALNVQQRRVTKEVGSVEIRAPLKTKDITEIIREVYGNIQAFFTKSKKETLEFEELAGSSEKLDRVFTFIPLLHLRNQNKIDLMQEGHFTPIHITMLKR